MAASFGGSIWQPFELRFDSPESDINPRLGEEVIDDLNSVEDTQGSNGQRGWLKVTNLRVIWGSHRSARRNLSIGYSAIHTISIRTAESKLRGRTQSLHIAAKFSGRDYVFLFTSTVAGSPRLFTTVQAVFRAYETSKLYRDLKLRGAVVKDKQLLLLPREHIVSRVPGVWNLSADQGNLGTMYITNVRVVWHADLATNFNVSIPYMQIQRVSVRMSKFGRALVIDTSPRSGAYMLGFKCEPEERMANLTKEMQAMHSTFTQSPEFGVEYSVEEAQAPLEARIEAPVVDDIAILDSEDTSDAWAAYVQQAAAAASDAVECNPDLGLAIEALPPGVTLARLWGL